MHLCVLSFITTRTRLVQIKFLPRGEGINVYVEREILNHSVLLHPQYGSLSAEHLCMLVLCFGNAVCIAAACRIKVCQLVFLLCITPARMGWCAASSSSGRCF